jgi:hypothetical protein
MPPLSIRVRLILLLVLPLAILAVSCGVLISELAQTWQSLAQEAQLVSVVRNTNLASKHFGDLKYWMSDFAVNQLASSQEKAAAAQTLLDADLKTIAPADRRRDGRFHG